MIPVSYRCLAFATCILGAVSCANAQSTIESTGTSKKASDSAVEQASQRQKIFDDQNIPCFTISIAGTTTIISPDPIVLVDISSDKAQGELSASTDNRIFRIKPTTAFSDSEAVIVTVVTKKYVSVLKLVAKTDPSSTAVYTIAINPTDAYRRSASNGLNSDDFEKLALFSLTKKRALHDIKASANGMQAFVGNIFVAGDHLLIDLVLKNKTVLPYDIASIRFRIIDKYTLTAHIAQEWEMNAEYTLYDNQAEQVTATWRNLFIFPKFTFPDNKILQIEIEEKEISGRKILINIDYEHVLQAERLQ